MWRARWFAGDASRGLVLAVVWFGAVVYPDAFVFGTGGLFKVVEPDWTAQVASAAGFATDVDAVSAAYRFEVAEATATASSLFGAGLLFYGLLRDGTRWPRRLGLLALFVVTTIVVGTLAHAVLFDDGTPWPPLTPGAREGIAAASAALAVATLLPWRVRWALALSALVGALALVNLYPENPYLNEVGLAWTRGKLMNFYGLASGVNLVWPYLAIVYLLRHRRAPSAGTSRRAPAPKNRSGPPL
jgi:hypothetical protein